MRSGEPSASEILDDDDGALAAGGDDGVSRSSQQVAPPRDDGEPRTLPRQRQRDAAADADAGARDERGLACKLQIHEGLRKVTAYCGAAACKINHCIALPNDALRT